MTLIIFTLTLCLVIYLETRLSEHSIKFTKRDWPDYDKYELKFANHYLWIYLRLGGDISPDSLRLIKNKILDRVSYGKFKI